MSVHIAILDSKPKQFRPQIIKPFDSPDEVVRVYTLKNKIRQFREENDISQYVLAFQIHISRQALNKIERGVSIPSVLVAIEIAKYFGTSVEQIFQCESQLYEE